MCEGASGGHHNLPTHRGDSEVLCQDWKYLFKGAWSSVGGEMKWAAI